MDLLFKREQSRGGATGVSFKLWSKIELQGDEIEITKKYRFGEAVLIDALQPNLLRNSVGIGVLAAAISTPIATKMFAASIGILAIIGIGSVVAYIWYNRKEKRYTSKTCCLADISLAQV